MVCDVCHKNEATVHLTEIIDDKVTKLHLCEQCAREKSEEMEEHFGLADLLSGLADLVPVIEKKEKKAEPDIKCSACGFSFQNFRKMGRLGCPACYDVFKDQLNPLLKKIHGSDSHAGKMPFKKEVIRDKALLLKELRTKMESAISAEEFEKAAQLRDRIKALEKRGNNK